MQLQSKLMTLTSVGIDAAPELVPAYNGDAQFNIWRDGHPLIDEAAVRADMIETLSMPGGMVWRIADVTADMLLGVATTAFVPPPHNAWIALLIIDQQRQRQGWGTAAADLLERYLFTPPEITHVGLALQAQNVGALRFWEGRGYASGLRRKEFGNEIVTLRLARRAETTAP